MKYQILLADDHSLIREALANLINSFEEFKVTATAGNGNEVIQRIAEGCMPYMIILDLNMPKMDGYATAKWLYETHPYIKLVILTMYDSEVALIRLLQLGVRGFLKKDIHPNELRNALTSVAEGGYYYSHDTTGKLGSLFKRDNMKNHSIERAMLSEAEISFLRLASTDMTYKEIAQEMKMTPRAIDGFRDNLFVKLDVKSRVGLAIYSVKNGIVTL